MKYCSKCGSLIDNGATVCSECGAPVGESTQQQAQPTYQQPPYNNAYQQPPYNGAYQQQYYNPQSPMTKEIETANTLGIVSLVCSLIGAGLFAIAAIVTGIIGMNKIKPFMDGKMFPDDKAKSAYNLCKAGMIIGIVKIALGIMFAIFWFVFVVIMAGSTVSSYF